MKHGPPSFRRIATATEWRASELVKNFTKLLQIASFTLQRAEWRAICRGQFWDTEPNFLQAIARKNPVNQRLFGFSNNFIYIHERTRSDRRSQPP
jgi:hypothetical protein